jgi:hypothetical protein
MADATGSGSPFENAFRQFTIAPFTNWAHAFSPVFNPQVIISENSGDAAVENHVLSQVGSYGKQLGTVIDAVNVLIARTLNRADLTPDEGRSVDDLRDLSRQVDAAVADFRGSPAKGVGKTDIDWVLAGLQSLRQSDPAAYGPLFEQLRRFVDGQADAPPAA